MTPFPKLKYYNQITNVVKKSRCRHSPTGILNADQKKASTQR